MKRIVFCLIFFAFAISVPVAQAGTDATAASPFEVRESVLEAMGKWANDPTNATGCGGVDCCVAPASDAECTAFARDYIKPSVGSVDASGWAYKVELFTIDDGDWICNPAIIPSAGGWTPCGTLPGQNVVDADVAAFLSQLAADQIQ